MIILPLHRNYFLKRGLLKRLVLVCLKGSPCDREGLLHSVAIKYMVQNFPLREAGPTMITTLYHQVRLKLALALEKVVADLIVDGKVIDLITEEEQEGSIFYRHSYRLAQAASQ